MLLTGTIREMTIKDYVQMFNLWISNEGLALSDADSKENINMYLCRNKGLSYVSSKIMRSLEPFCVVMMEKGGGTVKSFDLWVSFFQYFRM